MLSPPQPSASKIELIVFLPFAGRSAPHRIVNTRLITRATFRLRHEYNLNRFFMGHRYAQTIMRAEGQDLSGKEGQVARAVTQACCADAFVHLALVEVANFNDLRRLLGIRRADLITLDVAERIGALCPEASVAPVGRNLVELSLTTARRDSLDGAIACLHAGFESPLGIDGEAHRLRLLIGGASAPAADGDEVQLLERAEQALSKARERVAADPAGSPPGLHTDDEDVASDLRAAIGRDELFVQYQPKLNLRRQEITSVEALIRWQHPRRGLVMPNDFIPVAERTGVIADLTLWILRRAIADQRMLARNGHDLPVFINMAGVLLADAAFVEQVIALVEGGGAKLGVEITETSVIGDPQGAIEHLNRLSDIGVVVTIDDYGAGLSSLAYLKQLPASELKIDKLFVTQLSSSHRDPLIVRSTIDLAHALDMEVVAEGVETPASLALLSVMGCDMVQGFLISRPLTMEALLPYLFEERHLPLVQAPRIGFGLTSAFRSHG